MSLLHLIGHMLCQGHDSAHGLDVMLPTQQNVSRQASNPGRQEPQVKYMYCCSHPPWQFLPQKLAEWIGIQQKFRSSTNYPLFLLSMSEDFLSFHVFWTKMQHLLFHTSTVADRRSPLSAVVQMVQALHRGAAAMSSRLIPGCGTLAFP